LWGRAAPGEGDRRLHAWLGRQPDLSDAWLAGESLPLRPDDSYAGVAPATGLQPGSLYYYALTLAPQPPVPGSGPFGKPAYPSFTTAPSPGEPVPFTFAFGSCFRPTGDNDGRIFPVIEKHISSDSLRFILLIGDQVYSDDYETNHLGKVAQTLDEYRAVYQHVWSQTPLRRLLLNLPAFMILDDHEVEDDWCWIDGDRRVAYIPWWDRLIRRIKGRPLEEGTLPLSRVQNALQAYWEHQGMHAPPQLLTPQRTRLGQYALQFHDPGSLAYTFEYGGAAFFVMDTRSMRVRGRKGRTMLGEGQWEALDAWLKRVNQAYPVKFLVTSCSVLFRIGVDVPRDRWTGYPEERERLLSLLAFHGVKGLYLLSGDMHAAHATRVELYGPQGSDLPVWEFCASPFLQKTNFLARYTRLPVRSALLKRQECRFIVARPNFGLVRVDYKDQEPRVRFELYGDDERLLGEADG
jgi:alkaline phosphatase D